MSTRPAPFLQQVIAVAKKNFHADTRFKFNYISGSFVPAVMNLGLFGTVFYGFLRSNSGGLSELNGQNFVAFTILAALSASLFAVAFTSFARRFQAEKYWQTMYAILASPLNSWALLLGTSMAELVQFSTIAAIFLALAYAFWPVQAAIILESVGLLLLLYLMVSGFSLIRGVLLLVNENYDPILQYAMIITSYLSCFYFPESFLPSFVQGFAEVNPIYFVVYNLRAVWLGLPFQQLYLLYALVAAIVSPLVGTYFFRRVWRNHDISGY
jgi:ABC-type polysaccharide/polyol phosphate export permease